METQLSLFDPPEGKFVRRITYDETKPFLLGIHYARRMPCITDAFGLFVDGQMIGVVTYGVPASRHLCIGLAGEENADMVRELNRLCILPECNGGGITMPHFLSLTLSSCCQTEHLLSHTLTQHGRTLGTSTKRPISSTQAYRRKETMSISRTDSTLEPITRTTTAT